MRVWEPLLFVAYRISLRVNKVVAQAFVRRRSRMRVRVFAVSSHYFSRRDLLKDTIVLHDCYKQSFARMINCFENLQVRRSDGCLSTQVSRVIHSFKVQIKVMNYYFTRNYKSLQVIIISRYYFAATIA